MKEVILCCEMLQDEFEYAIKKTGYSAPVVWVDSGLHEYPEKLRGELEKHIRELERDYDTILLGFALCGNALVGIGSDTATLVVPRTDDCIRMLMWNEQGTLPDVDCHCLYYTGCWTKREQFMTQQYRRVCEKYGEKKGRKIYRIMLKNYTGVRLIDTGVSELAEYAPAVREMAELLELEYGEVTGSIRVVEKLLRHEWDEEFYILQPGQKFEQFKFLAHLGEGDSVRLTTQPMQL